MTEKTGVVTFIVNTVLIGIFGVCITKMVKENVDLLDGKEI